VRRSKIIVKSAEKWRRKMEQIGYARVSTDGQSVAAQLEQLQAAGCAKVFAENISGVVTDRKELAKAIKTLQAGDVLVVTKLDRLARSLRDLLNVLQVMRIPMKSPGHSEMMSPGVTR
jgi:DNA invertase Pin-like site-specific DNA recombinase